MAQKREAGEVEISTYNGKPIFRLYTGFRNDKGYDECLAFGVKKARLLLEHLEQLQDFVDDCGGEGEPC